MVKFLELSRAPLPFMFPLSLNGRYFFDFRDCRFNYFKTSEHLPPLQYILNYSYTSVYLYAHIITQKKEIILRLPVLKIGIMPRNVTDNGDKYSVNMILARSVADRE